MVRQRRKDTAPELAVRRVLREAGLGYRLHRKELAGSPDISNVAHGWAIFVHGCYWHQHPGCPRATLPAANREWWSEKFRKNQERDQRKADALAVAGLLVVVVWECETQDPERLRARLAPVLG